MLVVMLEDDGVRFSEKTIEEEERGKREKGTSEKCHASRSSTNEAHGRRVLAAGRQCQAAGS
jgi:hypothetical protein